MTILRQQIRDGADALTAAKKSVAITIAQNKQEQEHSQKLTARISDLEARTVHAMEQGEEKPAMEAAEAIAILEAERDASRQAQNRFATEIKRLKRVVMLSATLSCLRQRQTEMDAAANALDDMDAENNPDRIARKLSKAGCGAPLVSNSNQVSARLKNRPTINPKTAGRLHGCFTHFACLQCREFNLRFRGLQTRTRFLLLLFQAHRIRVRSSHPVKGQTLF